MNKITEEERGRIEKRLDSVNSGLWSHLQSEVQSRGDEVYFFFLITNRQFLHEISSVVLKVLQAESSKFKSTNFNASLTELMPDNKIIWYAFEDSEIRAGRPNDPIDAFPAEFKLSKTGNVWGVP